MLGERPGLKFALNLGACRHKSVDGLEQKIQFPLYHLDQA